MFKKLKSQIQEADGDPFSSPTSSTIRRSSSNNLESPNESADKLDHNGNFINENFPTNKQTFKEFGEYENDDLDQISILEHKLSQLDIEREQLKEQNEQSIEKNRTLMKKNDQLSHKIIELKAQIEQIEVEKDQMKTEYENSQAKLKEELDKEKLINEEDLQNLKNKLVESVNDYRETINKCKQRKQKLKNKLTNSIAALSMIDRILFATEFDEVTALTQLIKNLSKKPESDEEEEETFDEGELRQLVYEKQAEFESLKDEVEMNRAKLKEEKKKLIGEKQIQMDELQDKLANLDLKYKQITLNGNQELEEAKKRISSLEDELKKTKTEREILSSQLKTEEKEKNKAVLELPSMKARLAEIETEHEKRLKDELKFKQDYYEAVMSEIEENHRREMEANRKRIDRLRAELNEPEKTRESRLRAECEKLRKQLDEMNYFYANLVQEKSQLISVLNELKEKKDRFLLSNKLDQTLNEFSKSSLDNLRNQALEAAEIHYLRKVVYSYMMGIDSKTMANVIATILKFSDDEKRRLFENEKTKSSWFS